MSAPVTYLPDALGVSPDKYLQHLQALDWVRHGTVPRMEYFVSRVGLPYTYGKAPFARTYQPQPLAPVIEWVWGEAALLADSTFDVCFLNRYLDQSDHLGWHADDSPEMDDARPIVVVSLVAEREIRFREKVPPGAAPDTSIYQVGKFYSTDSLVLGHGSVLIMAPGMQDTHQHQIPKSSRRCGERISLTFRGYRS